MGRIEEYAVIVAGGKGSRMRQTIPKQFIEVNGLPILMHTLRAFYRYSEHIKIILVLPENDLAYWKALCEKHQFNVPHFKVIGGKTRSASVQNGLSEISNDEGLVAIHDGVRPLVSQTLISRAFSEAATHGNAIAAVPPKDSIRKITDNTTKAVNRQSFRLVQTPQTFKVKNIKEAYKQAVEEQTDDASVAEKAGQTIHLIEGAYENIKITTPEDIHIAAALLNNRATAINFKSS